LGNQLTFLTSKYFFWRSSLQAYKDKVRYTEDEIQNFKQADTQQWLDLYYRGIFLML
jgi:hypothetical protein